MSLNNNIAVLLEDKLWNIGECSPSNELTNQFFKVLEMLQESRQIIIKMRYGLNSDEHKYTWRSILNKINELHPDYPCGMHRIKDMERKAWITINRSLKISDFDIACNNLFNLTRNKSNKKDIPCVGGWI